MISAQVVLGISDSRSEGWAFESLCARPVSDRRGLLGRHKCRRLVIRVGDDHRSLVVLLAIEQRRGRSAHEVGEEHNECAHPSLVWYLVFSNTSRPDLGRLHPGLVLVIFLRAAS